MARPSARTLALALALPAALLCLGFVLARLLTPSLPELTRSAGNVYFACPGDTELQVNQTSVRCFRAAETIYQPPENCALGIDYSIDANADEDLCVSTHSTHKRVCANAFTLEIRPGPDRCRKRLPGFIGAPNHPKPIRPTKQ
jgi:hypothetical protein